MKTWRSNLDLWIFLRFAPLKMDKLFCSINLRLTHIVASSRCRRVVSYPVSRCSKNRCIPDHGTASCLRTMLWEDAAKKLKIQRQSWQFAEFTDVNLHFAIESVVENQVVCQLHAKRFHRMIFSIVTIGNRIWNFIESFKESWNF